jgi:hypothetical protein
VSDSWRWWPAASVAVGGGARTKAGVAWRVREKTAGRTRAAVNRGVTRGDCQKQEVVPVGLQCRRAVAEGSSGRWQCGAARRGEASARPGRRRRGAGVACDAQRGGAEQLKLGTWPTKAAGASGRAKTEQSREGG